MNSRHAASVTYEKTSRRVVAHSATAGALSSPSRAREKRTPLKLGSIKFIVDLPTGRPKKKFLQKCSGNFYISPGEKIVSTWRRTAPIISICGEKISRSCRVRPRKRSAIKDKVQKLILVLGRSSNFTISVCSIHRKAARVSSCPRGMSQFGTKRFAKGDVYWSLVNCCPTF